MPGATELDAITLSIELPLPLVIEVGLKLALTPAGIPLTVKATVLVKPTDPTTVAVKLLLLPGFIVSAAGVVLSAKLFVRPVTFNVTLVLNERLPLVPVIVKT